MLFRLKSNCMHKEHGEYIIVNYVHKIKIIMPNDSYTPKWFGICMKLKTQKAIAKVYSKH